MWNFSRGFSICKCTRNILVVVFWCRNDFESLAKLLWKNQWNRNLNIEQNFFSVLNELVIFIELLKRGEWLLFGVQKLLFSRFKWFKSDFLRLGLKKNEEAIIQKNFDTLNYCVIFFSNLFVNYPFHFLRIIFYAMLSMKIKLLQCIDLRRMRMEGGEAGY